MMEGRIVGRHALLTVVFSMPPRPDFEIECVIDTGFTDQLTLPQALVDHLALPVKGNMDIDLANGTSIVLPVYEGWIKWVAGLRKVRVLATGPMPLLGTDMMSNCDLFIRFREGGPVTVEASPLSSP